MSYETRDLTGKLFKNDRKTKDGHPDYTGECMIDGRAYFMDAWLKASGRGTKWMSFSFKEKRPSQQATSGPPPRQAPSNAPRTATHGEQRRQGTPSATGFDDMDSDIPF